MTVPTRAAVWLDHHEARVFHVDLEGFDERLLHAPAHHFSRHPKAGPHVHPDDEHHFFVDLAKTLATAEEILVLGPSTAKNEFLHYVQQQARDLSSKITGVETADHPTDAQIVAHMRTHFGMPVRRAR